MPGTGLVTRARMLVTSLGTDLPEGLDPASFELYGTNDPILSGDNTDANGGDFRDVEPSIAIATLGARWTRDEQEGGYRLDYIYQSDPEFLERRGPLLKPGLANAFLVGFIESMADFGNPIVVGGQFSVLSTEIFFAIVGAQYDQGRAASLAWILTLFALGVFALQRAVMGKQSYTTVSGIPVTQLIDRGTLDPRANMMSSGNLTALGAASVRGIQHEKGYDSVYPLEMAVLWGLATGSIPLVSDLVGRRYFIPLTATYTPCATGTPQARDASSAGSIDPLLFVFSAGNSGQSGLTRPKMAQYVLAVAAAGRKDTVVQNLQELVQNPRMRPHFVRWLHKEKTFPWKKPVDLDSVMLEIDDARAEDRARRLRMLG